MNQPDPTHLFRQAEQAFRAGNHAAARHPLRALRALVGIHPAIAHLSALVEQADGRPDAALAFFVEATRAAPADPQIANNHANLLHDLGRSEEAIALFDAAITAHPGIADLRVNRALTLQAIGNPIAALADLDRAVALLPDVRTLTARAGALHALGRLDDAAVAFDAALAAQPDRLPALQGRARIALERGDADAVPRFRRLCAHTDRDPAMLMALADALEAEGNPESLAVLADAVAAQPDWIEGQDRLARMRSEAGIADDLEGYRTAIARLPGHAALHAAYWRALARAGRHADALAAMATSGILRAGPDDRLVEAVLASEAGQADRATRLLATLPRTVDIDLVRGRHALRTGDPIRAARILEDCVRRQPDGVSAWAHLGLAWTAMGDARADWLYRQAGCVGILDLGFDGDTLHDLADRLRSLHRTRAHPIGQSLRGGTQTRGALFARQDPVLRGLRDRLARLAAAHMAALPPMDPVHPLLRHRDTPLRFAGSWSVRLASSGFHVSHIHPQGLLSSACYIALPDDISDERERPGWLEIGRPPAELGLDLAPFETIRPAPGRLVLFPSYVFHGTRPFAGGERLSVAFDLAAG